MFNTLCVVWLSADSHEKLVQVSEPLNWTYPNPRTLIRYQDGSASALMVATKVGDYQLSVPYLSEFDAIDFSTPFRRAGEADFL
jgi:hypothetical protein